MTLSTSQLLRVADMYLSLSKPEKAAAILDDLCRLQYPPEFLDLLRVADMYAALGQHEKTTTILDSILAAHRSLESPLAK